MGSQLVKVRVGTGRGSRRSSVAGIFGLLAALAIWGPVQAADWANVVMYHRFGEDNVPSTNVRLDQFEAHLSELRDGGYNVLPLPDIVAAFRDGKPLPDRTVAITVDDAYLSVYAEAWPRLRALNMPFTLFVATQAIDSKLPGYMNWDQMRELVADGVTIGSQTATHPHMAGRGDAANRRDIDEAHQRLEAELGKPPELFAYPYGEISLAVEKLVADAGYTAAFGQHSGVMHAGENRFALPRFALNERYGDLKRFRLAVNALPLRVSDVVPRDRLLVAENPPPFGFTLVEDLPRAKELACFASNQPGPVRLERLGLQRVEVRLDQPFAPGRGRINCTLPGAGGRWHWYGVQFYTPRPR